MDRWNASILNVLLFLLLVAGKMGCHFPGFNNVQHQIQASKEIRARHTGNHSFYHFQIIEVNLMNTWDNMHIWMHNNNMSETVCVCESLSDSLSHKSTKEW